MGQPAQLVVYDRDKPVERRPFAASPGMEQLRHFLRRL
jgi:hypothetical protein